MTRDRAIIIGLAAVFGLLGVAAGAFGAHALRGQVAPRDLEIWGTAAHYQQVHAAVLLGVAALPTGGRLRRAVAGLLAAGIVVFSGTLFAMVLGGPRWLGAITPLGGLSLMAGWFGLLALAVRAARAAPRE